MARPGHPQAPSGKITDYARIPSTLHGRRSSAKLLPSYLCCCSASLCHSMSLAGDAKPVELSAATSGVLQLLCQCLGGDL